MEPTCFGLTTLTQIVLGRRDHPPPYNMSYDCWWSLRKHKGERKYVDFYMMKNFIC